MLIYKIKTKKNSEGFWDIPDDVNFKTEIFPPVDNNKMEKNLKIAYAFMMMLIEKHKIADYITFRNDSFLLESNGYFYFYFYIDFFLDDYTLYHADTDDDVGKLERLKKIKSLL
jgi:hypothetical protein